VSASWWVRVLARIPLAALYGVAHLVAWMAYRVVPYRKQLVQASLATAFPELSERQLRAVRRRYYLRFAQMAVELVKASALAPAEIRRRVRIVNLEEPQALLAQGQSSAAHRRSPVQLGMDAARPVPRARLPARCRLQAVGERLGGARDEEAAHPLRQPLGAREELLLDILRRHGVVRAIAMVADQEPTTSERRYWTGFLNRDTAFYMGPEEIARVTRFPVFFIAMRRRARGYYEMEFLPLAAAGGAMPPGALTERYARLVEAQIHAAPPDWLWSHKRWKLKKSLYQNR